MIGEKESEGQTLDISTILMSMGAKPIDIEGSRGDIELWNEWYKGFVPKVHRYRQYNGVKSVQMTRSGLRMAKKVCEDWANLLLNEKVVISCENEAQNELLADILEENNFRVQANKLCEITFALGTGAFVESIRGGKVKIDYVRAEYIYPLACEGGRITECAFCREVRRGKDIYYYIQLHVIENGGYVVYNALYSDEGVRQDINALAARGERIAEKFAAPQGVKLFQIVTPNIINSRRTASPFGVSVFAGALDTLEAVDIIFDSLMNEFKLGKKRLFMNTSTARMMMSEDGVKRPVFDPNDIAFYALDQGADLEGQKPLTEINMTLRVKDHEEGLERCLSLLSDLCGLGNDRYKVDYGGGAAVRTATEVISDKSELYQNLRKHELVFEEALISLGKAVLALSGKGTGEIKVTFDDAIIEDKQSEFGEYMQLLGAGVLEAWEVRMWYTGESEEEAKMMVPQAAEVSGGGENEEE